MVPYIPGGAKRKQGSHSNGAWNPQENLQQQFQQTSPNAYFLQHGKADNISGGASMLS
jgi:hypothetical protein